MAECIIRPPKEKLQSLFEETEKLYTSEFKNWIFGNATQAGFFLAKFLRNLALSWNPESESAGSPPACGFTSIPDKSQAVGFFSGEISAKFGQNWNRTSDTRIFSPLLYHLSYLALKGN